MQGIQDISAILNGSYGARQGPDSFAIKSNAAAIHIETKKHLGGTLIQKKNNLHLLRAYKEVDVTSRPTQVAASRARPGSCESTEHSTTRHEDRFVFENLLQFGKQVKPSAESGPEILQILHCGFWWPRRRGRGITCSLVPITS